ncbi:MAG: heme exporter protein CcmB [Bacteriovoracaceae bacterium]|nr:heme exporter protein CcmB [Bacteroidota bacterium]
MMIISTSYHIFVKEFVSEFRTRYALNALLMFVVTTLSIILFSIGQESPSIDVLSGTLWIVIFFSAMSGLSRTFVAEEERGTSLTLRLLVNASSVYIGKLVYNFALILVLSVIIAVSYVLFITEFTVKTFEIFWLTILLGSAGLASASTILAAIIAKANTKGTLFPVLAFPILLPLLLTCINATKLATEGAFLVEAVKEFQILISFTVVMIATSFLVFDFVWKD